MKNYTEKLSPMEKMATKSDTDQIILSANDELQRNAIRRSEENKFNHKVEDFNQKFENHIEEVNKIAEKMSEDMNDVEISPVYQYLLVEPFKVNPFNKMKKTDSGLILADGIAPIYKSEEDGLYHEEEEMIQVGTVVEVGHKCEFVKPGDIVMFPKIVTAKVPFYNLGFVLVHENKVMCVINSKLNERKDGNN